MTEGKLRGVVDGAATADAASFAAATGGLKARAMHAVRVRRRRRRRRAIWPSATRSRSRSTMCALSRARAVWCLPAGGSSWGWFPII